MQVTALKAKRPGPPMDRNGYLRSLCAHDGPHFPIPKTIDGHWPNPSSPMLDCVSKPELNDLSRILLQSTSQRPRRVPGATRSMRAGPATASARSDRGRSRRTGG